MKNEMEELTARLDEVEKLLKEETKKREELEEECLESKKTFIRSLKELPVMITASDEDGRIVFFNREFERVSGYNSDDISDDVKAQKLLFPEGNSIEASESSIGKEWKFISKDGTEKCVVWSNVSKYLPMLGWKNWQVGLDITELKKAQTQAKTLSGLLPICARCKKIRDDKGYWNHIETFIEEHSEADFTHGICPECVDIIYSELKDSKKSEKD